ncbi:hypothetical protein CHH67_12925 [Paenibacillus campinasensis]|uniref:Uncharacterized protein n=1 Tax=Paenibacillus campinasensis TaxID=66347 RepID=A0A268ESN7_9BACL|nr:hypothetical protein CHH67_12925 [Paenibacillus campinasensis]
MFRKHRPNLNQANLDDVQQTALSSWKEYNTPLSDSFEDNVRQLKLIRIATMSSSNLFSSQGSFQRSWHTWMV